jgi:hypothetical protein
VLPGETRAASLGIRVAAKNPLGEKFFAPWYTFQLRMTEANLYTAPPAIEPLLKDCSFYHTIFIPGFGVIPGQWDLRPGVADYLGNFDF